LFIESRIYLFIKCCIWGADTCCKWSS